jgi:molybdopterin synthase sulfur carrier subunit
MIRVQLPTHLRILANVNGEVLLEIDGPVTQRAVVEALEARFPALHGTIHDYATRYRRPLLRFYACQLDLSHESPDALLPEAVMNGSEPYLIISSIAGG